MQACLDARLPVPIATTHATALVQQLRQTVELEQHPLLHAQALLLQARLASLLTPSESALQLAQQAAAVLQHQVLVENAPNRFVQDTHSHHLLPAACSYPQSCR